MSDKPLISTDHFQPATLADVSDAETLSDSAKEKLSAYLGAFLRPIKNDRCVLCPACESHLFSGGVEDAFFATFQWGIAHGDGFCSKCGWNIRMYHFIDLGEGEQRIVFPLAYRLFRKSDDAEVNPAEWWEKKQEDAA